MKTNIMPTGVWEFDDASDLNRSSSSVITLYAVVVCDGTNDSIFCEITHDTEDEEGEYEWSVDLPDRGSHKTKSGFSGSEQGAADAVAEIVANWFMSADPSEVIGFVPASKQAEAAQIIGVDQATISRWMSDDAEMLRSTRTFIAYMNGVRREPFGGKWTLTTKS
jgi:hypothetical protein